MTRISKFIEPESKIMIARDRGESSGGVTGVGCDFLFGVRRMF